MGKQLDLPAHRLLGQQVRRRVSVAAWTKPVPPETLSAEVQRAVSEGYSIMKMHSCEYYDILEQNGAVEAVAPPGFRMHYDFNHNRGLVAVLPILRQLEGSPVVGFIEDPCGPATSPAGADLRRRVRIPLIMHPTPGGLPGGAPGPGGRLHEQRPDRAHPAPGRGLGGGQGPGGLLQITGGTLTKALAMHLAAVIPACTMHTVNLDDQYEDDITTERIPVVAGTSPSRMGRGWGSKWTRTPWPAWRYTPPPRCPATSPCCAWRTATPSPSSLTTVNVQAMTGREEGTIRGLRLELWDDDGSRVLVLGAHARVQARTPFSE